MSNVNPAIWWVLLAVLVLAVVIWLLVSRQNKLNEARRDARVLRERAGAGEAYVTDAEQQASRAQSQAREASAYASDAEREAERARVEADRLRAEAEGATEQARAHRDDLTNDYLRADEIDPDTDVRR